MGRLIGFDPGLTSGIALFADGVLVEAGKIKCARRKGKDIVEDTCRFVLPPWAVDVDSFCGEVPMIYPRSRADPNKLPHLAGITYRAHCLCGSPTKTWFPRPRAWKGTVPKDVHNQRVLGSLSSTEREVVDRIKGKRDDAIDAVGLGLWALGRQLSRLGP